MEYINNTLKTDFKEVTFDFPIKEVIRYRGMYLVLISPLDNLEYPLNVYGVNSQGDIMWKIKSFNGEQIIFDKIDVNMANGKVYLKDINHFKYAIDSETGEILSGKIRPLEDEPIEEKDETPISKIKKVASASSDTVDKISAINPKTLLIIGFVIIVFLLFKLIGKGMEVSSLEKRVNELESQVSSYEEALVIQEQKIQTYEDLILNLRNTAESQITTNTDTSSPEVITSEDTTQNQVPTREEEVSNGVSAVVNLIDSIIGNVSTGTATTIEDVNKPKVTEGYTVSNIIDGQRLTVSDGTNEINIKLISVSECKKETLEALFPVGSQIYIENDSKKYDDNGYMLAYVWASEPNPDNLNSMANYVILKNGYGKFVNESPNIKYNRFFF